MKLTGQTSQYWTNVESMRASRCQEPIETWFAMKDKLRDKYVPTSYFARALDGWHQFTQGTKSAKDYVA